MAPVRAVPVLVVAVIAAVLVPGGPALAQEAVLVPGGPALAQAAPAQPTGLSVSASSHDSVTLTWDDPGDASITGYQVLRRSRDGSSYDDGEGAAEFVAIVDDTGSAATSYTDTSVTLHTRYVYRVKSRNAAGLSPRSSYVNAETAEAPAAEPTPEPACPGGSDPPTPTEVAVTAVPIVVTSTTADYFVLYTSHVADGTTVELPVQVALGADGTTTLAENVAALPVERYRVEKYLIADPADVDGDCIDDITELADPTGMNPVNPAVALELSRGAVSIPDRATFETLSYKGTSVNGDEHLRNLEYVKFTIALMDTDRPVVYFQNTNTYRAHPVFLRSVGLFDHPQYDRQHMIYGEIVYHPSVVAPDGSLGVYRFQHQTEDSYEFEEVAYAYGALAASMPLLDNNLAYYPVPEFGLLRYRAERATYDDSRIDVLLQEDVFPDVDFIPLNVGEGYGFLRVMSLDERPNPRDIVVYESLPNELSRVAGIISTVPQTPLSHVNLRAIQDEAPNAFIRGALEDSDIEALVDSHVYYEVSSSGYSIRAATQAEVDEHYDASRPAEAQTPERDLSVTTITSLGEVGFGDWDAFGVKAANVAVLGTLEFPEGTVPDGFAVPFYFYDEFMKHNDLYDDIEDMLADPDFQSDYDTKADELKKLRKKIKKAETPEWIDTALTTMHATFAEGTSLRYRSSTNNEDLPDFSGAGLYDSKTQHPDETTEDGISKSLKQVYASLWNFRAFIERDFHRVDHTVTAMGVLVHPNYSDESVNGVAVSTDPVYGTDEAHYVNSQAGEDLVTNPEANSVPEEVLLHPDGTYTISAFSNQAPRGQLLMTDDQLGQLRTRLDSIHDKFAELYDIAEDEQFAMEIEFKITSDNVLAIKQARPWIFASEPLALHSGVALTGSFEGSRTTHDGEPFRVVVEFSDVVDIAETEFKDHAVSVTGGLVERVARVAGRAKEWLIRVAPDSLSADVTVALAYDLPCTDDGAICTLDGRRLSSPVEHTVKSVIPRVPDMPVLRALSSDAAHLEVHLEWNDTDRADSYEVQFLQSGKWRDLPAGSTEISFDGASAVVSGLPAGDVYSLRVRGVNPDGVSAWSAPLALPHTIVLESELSAGRQTDIVPSNSGYSIFGTVGGTLSPGSFVIGDTTHTVQLLAHAGGSLWLGVSPALPADFILRVGDSTYLASQSKVPDIPFEGVYWWPSAPASLFGDDPVAVRLILHPDDQLGDRGKAPVTAYFGRFPSEHVKDEDVSFRVNFSERVTTTADALRNHVLSVSGGTISGVEAAGSGTRIWTVSVTPEARVPITVEIEADLDCELPEAVCAADGRRLFNKMELTIEPRPNNPATGAPAISGTPEAGQTLTVDTSGISDADGMTDATLSYQWVSYDGRRYSDIAGATAASYTLVSADEGRAFKVRVSFTDGEGYEESLTGALARSDRPYALTAATSDGAVALTWKLPAGWPHQRYYRILRNRPELGEAEPLVHVSYTEPGGPTYTDTDVEPGVLYVYRVMGVDFLGLAHGASEPIEIRTPESTPEQNSPATGAPTVQPPAKPAKPSVSSVSQDSVTIEWDDPGDSSITGYQILRREPAVHDPGVFPVIVADTATAATSYTDTTVAASTQYVYRVKAINAAGLSPESSFANAQTPAAPQPPRRPDHESLDGEATGEGTGSLDWADVSEADSYDVRFWDRDVFDWVVLAVGANSNGITLTFDGSSATVSGLPEGYSEYWFNVRSRNTHGVSQWPGNGIRITPYQPPPSSSSLWLVTPDTLFGWHQRRIVGHWT
ncbi:fibronectin type III domain-containing protein [Candidatus Poriferisodalis sp.]|uniref:fibronectin type III domain-containing protein n=1 Tax=Candidatus Poriferisodalis sp. TaxID=3101277 RepID=UPI003B01BFC4